MFRHLEMASRGRPAKAEKVDTSFGTWLKEQRDDRGWAGELLAEYAGTSQSVVSALERGAKPVTLDMAVRFAVALARDEWANQKDRLIREAKLTAAGFSVSEFCSQANCLDLLAPSGFENMPLEARHEAAAVALQHFQFAYRMEMQKWSERSGSSTSFFNNLPPLSGEADSIVFPRLSSAGQETSTDSAIPPTEGEDNK